MANIKCNGKISGNDMDIKGNLDLFEDATSSSYSTRMQALNNKLNISASNGMAINNMDVATKNDVNNVGKSVVQLGIESNGDTITLSQPITNFKFIWIINFSTSEAFRCPQIFPSVWLSQHYGREIQIESYDGSRYRCRFDNSQSFTVIAKYYANDVYVYGIN